MIPLFTKEEFIKTFSYFLSSFLKIPQVTSLKRKLEISFSKKKPSLIWLQLLDCAGCSEKLIRTKEWPLFEFLTALVDLKYHELLMFDTGHSAEALLKRTLTEEQGDYLLLVEGAIPYRDRGRVLRVSGEPVLDFLVRISEGARLVLAFGNCAVNGGLPATPPSPTCAIGLPNLLGTERVISLLGCPGKAKALVALIAYFRLFETLPPIDRAGRPVIG